LGNKKFGTNSLITSHGFSHLQGADGCNRYMKSVWYGSMDYGTCDASHTVGNWYHSEYCKITSM